MNRDELLKCPYSVIVQRAREIGVLSGGSRKKEHLIDRICEQESIEPSQDIDLLIESASEEESWNLQNDRLEEEHTDEVVQPKVEIEPDIETGSLTETQSNLEEVTESSESEFDHVSIDDDEEESGGPIEASQVSEIDTIEDICDAALESLQRLSQETDLESSSIEKEEEAVNVGDTVQHTSSKLTYIVKRIFKDAYAEMLFECIPVNKPYSTKYIVLCKQQIESFLAI